MNQKKSLLERYGIPVNHLDFKYIAECNDAREMEKMVHILRSGEEGYYPDLTKCAEDKLRELKPQSRLFRVEEQIRGREALPSEEWKPIYDWNHDIKDKDKKLQQLNKNSQTSDLDDLQLPPIRTGGLITLGQKKESDGGRPTTGNSDKLERFKSTDYRKWDQYDAEEEILRMDLAEERVQEEVERKNRMNSQKLKSTSKIEEIFEETEKEMDKLQNLSNIEKEKLSEEFRLRGNEYFRAKEFDSALAEYTRAIQTYPEMAVAAYNNRAVTYFKQQKFHESIKDCESCLKLEPGNVKARLRLAEANFAYGNRRESYQLYINVLGLDPQNAVALKATTELRKIFEDLPPPNATRLQITDESSKTSSKTTKTPTPQKTAPTTTNKKKQSVNPSKNYDLADLVKPNRIVKNRILKAAETFGKNLNTPTKNGPETNKSKEKKDMSKNIKKMQTENTAGVITELRVPGNVRGQSARGKILIEEI